MTMSGTPSMPAFRSVVSVLVRLVVRSFSTTSRPALRAAACGGRPRPATTLWMPTSPGLEPKLPHNLRGLHVRELLGDPTVSDAEHVHTPHATTLGLLFVEGEDPPHNAAVAHGKHVLGIEPRHRCRLEEAPEEPTDRLLALETLIAGVLEDDVVGHQLCQTVDIVLIEGIVEPLDRRHGRFRGGHRRFLLASTRPAGQL